jgi:hypothetical protein
MGKDLFWIITQGRAYFAKRLKRVGALYRIDERGGGYGHICPVFFLPSC